MSRPFVRINPKFLNPLLSLAATKFFLCSAICYYPDGVSVAPQDVPCNGGSSNSVCCGPGYACLSNKICKRNNETLDNLSSQTYVRGSCTDKKWLSAGCPSFCLANRDGGEGMKKCENSNSDSYCCLQGSRCTSKCNKGPVIIRFPGEPSTMTTIDVTVTSEPVLSTGQSNTTGTNLGLQTTTGSSSSSQASSSSKVLSSDVAVKHSQSLPNSSKAGLGVGLVLGSIAVALGMWVVWKRIRRPKPARVPPHNDDSNQDKDKDAKNLAETGTSVYQIEPLVRHELEWDNNARELPVETNSRHEADTISPSSDI